MRWRKRAADSHHPRAETLVRAGCTDCGEVVLPLTVVTVHIQDSGVAHVAYRCPDCRVRNAQWIPSSVATTLRQVGVSVHPLNRPAEVDEVRAGPPIKERDVTAFVQALRRPDWQAELSG